MEEDFFTGLGAKGAAEFRGVHVCRAGICLAGHRADAQLVLLERRQPMRYHFHEACDAESADLELVGTRFCDARGRVRLGCVKACGPEVMSGGFLYIEDIGHKSLAFKEPDVGAVVTRKLLQETVLRGKWSIAVVIPNDAELLWFLQAIIKTPCVRES